MSGVMAEITSWPWGWAWLTLFAVVLLRAGATYGIGRAVAAGTIRRREPGPRLQRAVERVEQWGPPVVTASFLTIGAQTAINAAAGLVGMTVPRYLLGLVPGAALWATIWSTVGAGLFVAASRAGAGQDEALLVVALVVVLVVTVGVVAHRTRRDRLTT